MRGAAATWPLNARMWSAQVSNMDEAMLSQILPEVHSIFSDEAVETDLASIKRIKKICADTKHIVANREMEIKDIVKGKVPLRGSALSLLFLLPSLSRALGSIASCVCEGWS